MGIPPAGLAIDGAGVLPMDVETAEETLLPIHHQELAVVTPVVEQRRPPTPAMEPVHMDSALA